MRFRPSVRKFVLTVHVTCSVGWVGAVLVYLALGASAATTSDPERIRAAWMAMELSGWFVIVPLALASLTTGVLISWGTPWGLLNHYWVVMALVVTVVCNVVLLLHMPSVSHLANIARESATADPRLREGDLMHPAIGLVLLLGVTVLNMYKPRGLTRRGQRARARGLSQTDGDG